MTLDASVDPGFSTPAMSGLFSPQAHVRAMLQVQAALVLACADAGIEQTVIADEIASLCASVELDARQILADGWQLGTPVLALRSALGAHLSAQANVSLQRGHGATSQDIIDSAFQIQIRSGLGAVAAALRPLGHRLAQLATEHRVTPMIGRTFVQHARPITFGLRAAQWLDPVGELLAAIQVAQRSGNVQLGGPAGTLEQLGAQADQVSARFAARLELQQPVTSWHGDRRRITETCEIVGRVARCMAKIATDVAVLSSSEIGEIHVRSGGSSSMVGKRNPFNSVRAIAAADACSGAVHMIAAARPIELERGLGGWHIEWLAVPLVFMTGAASVDAIGTCLQSLAVDEAAMLRNLADHHSPAATVAAAATVDRIIAHHATTLWDN